MRLVKYLFLFLFTFLVALFFFMPKENLYYYLEKELQKHNIIISNEKISTTPVSLKIVHADVSAQGIPIAYITEAKFTTYLFYNTLSLNSIELKNIAKDFIQSDIEEILLKENITNPFYISVDITGEFGKAKGYIDLKKRLLHLDVTLQKEIPAIRSYLQQSDKGWYYEYKF